MGMAVCVEHELAVCNRTKSWGLLFLYNVICR